MINVALGGTLVQHVPDLTGNSHRIDERAREVVHAVSIVPDGTLAHVLGTTSIDVNSLHHQAVDSVGHGLEIAAHSEDGAVESVTAIGGARLVGVQWHPELLENAVSDRLFGWLVTEASKPVVIQPPITDPRSVVASREGSRQPSPDVSPEGGTKPARYDEVNRYTQIIVDEALQSWDLGTDPRPGQW